MEEKERQIYKIGKLTFDTEEEYRAARRDLRKIATLNLKKSMDYSDIKALIMQIREKDIHFESRVGQEFLKSIDYRVFRYRVRTVRRIFKILCCIIIACCVIFFCVDGFLEILSRKEAQRLRDSINSNMYFADTYEKDGKQLQENTLSEPEGILQQYRALHDENFYFTGWLKVADTGIDYPVMQGPDNEFYLSHNMKNEYDKNGLLVLDTRCQISDTSPQYIVYGHNVQSGRMFGELLNYKEKSYYEHHPVISFDLLTESGEYEIAAVFIVSIKEESSLAEFYQYDNFFSKEEFENYIKEIKENSLYETGVVPEYGQPLVALVTCEYTKDEGRFVVIASQKDRKDTDK